VQAASAVQLLRKYGAYVEARDASGCTPLFNAASADRDDLVRVLAGLGGDVNTRDDQGWPAATDAVQRGAVDALRALLFLGADMRARGGPFGEPLLAAAAAGRTRAVELLLGRGGVDPNSFGGGEYGYALVAAAAGGKERVVRMLVKAGARIENGGESFADAVDAARAGGHDQVAQWLEQWKEGRATMEFEPRIRSLGSMKMTMPPKRYDQDDTDFSGSEKIQIFLGARGQAGEGTQMPQRMRRRRDPFGDSDD